MFLIDDYAKNLRKLFIISRLFKTLDRSINFEEVNTLYSKLKSSINKYAKEQEIKFNRPMCMTFFYNKFKFELNFDICVKIQKDQVISNQFILRIFSLDEELSFRSTLDNEEMKVELEKMGWRRLMMQIHFDEHPYDDIFHPKYHFQMGGINIEKFFWYPKLIDIPRIANFPMELILFLEFIVLNFYKNNRQTQNLLYDDNWKSARKVSELQVIKPFIKQCMDYFNSTNREKNKRSFLMSL